MSCLLPITSRLEHVGWLLGPLLVGLRMQCLSSVGKKAKVDWLLGMVYAYLLAVVRAEASRVAYVCIV